MDGLKTRLEKMLTGHGEDKIYERLSRDRIVDPGPEARVFKEGEAYFSITLPRMFLADVRRLWQGFAPLALAVVGFQHDGKDLSVPIFAGKKVLSSIDQFIDGQLVDLRNTTLLGPVPYTGGGLDLFLGLFRTPTKDVASDMFNVLKDIAGSLDVPGLSGYLSAAKVISEALSKVLGLSALFKLRLGVRDEFHYPVKEEWLAYVNCSKDAMKKLGGGLWIRDGDLVAGHTSESAKAITEYDHCLARIEYLAERHDYTTLPFHQRWNQVQAFVWEGQPEKAKWAFVELAQLVAQSPDLTRRHRMSLVSVYRANFETELEVYHENIGRLTTRGGTEITHLQVARGGSVKSIIDRDVFTSEKAGFDRDVSDQLRWIGENVTALQQLKGETGPKVKLTDDILSAQISLPKQNNVDPQVLADAMLVGTFNRWK
jgi:hypothetical protein